jgi:hypothetical protein
LIVTVRQGQGKKWTAARDQHLGVFLRVRDINTLHPEMRGPMTILDITNDQLTLKGATVPIFTFNAGSVLYLPSLSGRLVHERVHDYLATHAPFGISQDPTKAKQGGEAPPDIPGFSKPKNRQNIIGVYDGGGNFNTNVFRPSGNCRMRNQKYWREPEWYLAHGFIPWRRGIPRVQQFCFVCRYIIVNKFGPDAFDVLDREYPQDC